MNREEAQECFVDSVAYVDKYYSIQELQDEVLSESIRLDHSSYDMFYFVLARRFGATLFTLDRKLIQLCEEQGVQCVAILENGEF
jgi:toxin-antitoxin system, toxin component, PIN family